jgi:hypothetical protein
MSDSGQTLFIIHSNGQSWIEMGREGTIDIYSTNSFNVRTQGDINFHADRDINLNATRNLNMYGENINIESAKNYSQRTGGTYKSYTIGSYTVKVDGAMSQTSTGQASYKSQSVMFINGSKVNLNSGSAGLNPEPVKPIQRTNHTDTVNSPNVGWMNPAPSPLVSITNRAPSHQPWVGSGLGVDVKISSGTPPSPTASSRASSSAVAAMPSVPKSPVSPAAISSVPSSATGSSILPQATTQAMVAQYSANSADSKNVINKVAGLTTSQTEAAGLSKPGSTTLIDTRMNQGMPIEKALSSVVTGVNGIANSSTLIKNATVAAGIMASNFTTAATNLVNAGILSAVDSTSKVAGLVMGTVTNGIKAVTDLVNTGVTGVSGLANSVASGKFAAGLADSMAFPGLKTSIGGLVNGIKGKAGALGNTISGLAGNLRSGLQNAFAAVEQSFGTLKAGLPNVLGNATTIGLQKPSDVAKSSDSYAVAEAEVESATDSLLKAKRDYRNNQSPENLSLLQTAEANLSAARQQQSKASMAFLKSSAGGVVNTAAGTMSTFTSGLNSLPGGPAVFQSITDNSAVQSATKKVTTAIGVIDTTLSAVGGIAGNKAALVGNLVGNTKNLVDNAMSKATASVSGALNNVRSGAAGVMAQLQTSFAGKSSGSAKAAAAAVGTFDKTAIIAKSGQLMGNPKIPVPGVFTSTASPTDVNQHIAQVSDLLNDVKEANAQKLKAATILAEALKSGNTSQEQIQQLGKALSDAESKLLEAEKSYTATISA